MGVGTPSNIIEGVARGVDFFDCVMPARNARHGKLFTWQGAMNIKNAKYKLDDRPIDPECDCPVCRRFSRAYVRHLFAAEEILAMRLAVMHNLYFYNKLAQRIRDSLDAGCFADFRREYKKKNSGGSRRFSLSKISEKTRLSPLQKGRELLYNNTIFVKKEFLSHD